MEPTRIGIAEISSCEPQLSPETVVIKILTSESGLRPLPWRPRYI